MPSTWLRPSPSPGPAWETLKEPAGSSVAPSDADDDDEADQIVSSPRMPQTIQRPARSTRSVGQSAAVSATRPSGGTSTHASVSQSATETRADRMPLFQSQPAPSRMPLFYPSPSPPREASSSESFVGHAASQPATSSSRIAHTSAPKRPPQRGSNVGVNKGKQKENNERSSSSSPDFPPMGQFSQYARRMGTGTSAAAGGSQAASRKGKEKEVGEKGAVLAAGAGISKKRYHGGGGKAVSTRAVTTSPARPRAELMQATGPAATQPNMNLRPQHRKSIAAIPATEVIDLSSPEPEPDLGIVHAAQPPLTQTGARDDPFVLSSSSHSEPENEGEDENGDERDGASKAAALPAARRLQYFRARKSTGRARGHGRKTQSADFRQMAQTQRWRKGDTGVIEILSSDEAKGELEEKRDTGPAALPTPAPSSTPPVDAQDQSELRYSGPADSDFDFDDGRMDVESGPSPPTSPRRSLDVTEEESMNKDGDISVDVEEGYTSSDVRPERTVAVSPAPRAGRMRTQSPGSRSPSHADARHQDRQVGTNTAIQLDATRKSPKPPPSPPPPAPAASTEASRILPISPQRAHTPDIQVPIHVRPPLPPSESSVLAGQLRRLDLRVEDTDVDMDVSADVGPAEGTTAAAASPPGQTSPVRDAEATGGDALNRGERPPEPVVETAQAAESHPPSLNADGPQEASPAQGASPSPPPRSRNASQGQNQSSAASVALRTLYSGPLGFFKGAIPSRRGPLPTVAPSSSSDKQGPSDSAPAPTPPVDARATVAGSHAVVEHPATSGDTVVSGAVVDDMRGDPAQPGSMTLTRTPSQEMRVDDAMGDPAHGASEPFAAVTVASQVPNANPASPPLQSPRPSPNGPTPSRSNTHGGASSPSTSQKTSSAQQSLSTPAPLRRTPGGNSLVEALNSANRRSARPSRPVSPSVKGPRKPLLTKKPTADLAVDSDGDDAALKSAELLQRIIPALSPRYAPMPRRGVGPSGRFKPLPSTQPTTGSQTQRHPSLTPLKDTTKPMRLSDLYNIRSLNGARARGSASSSDSQGSISAANTQPHSATQVQDSSGLATLSTTGKRSRSSTSTVSSSMSGHRDSGRVRFSEQGRAAKRARQASPNGENGYSVELDYEADEGVLAYPAENGRGEASGSRVSRSRSDSRARARARPDKMVFLDGVEADLNTQSSRTRSPSSDALVGGMSHIRLSNPTPNANPMHGRARVKPLRPPPHYLAKDLPHELEDVINSLPAWQRNMPAVRLAFESAISVNTASDEPHAPPIAVINDVDEEVTPPWEFHYSNQMWHGPGVPGPDVENLQWCGCVGKCNPRSMACECAKRQREICDDSDVKGFLYDEKGRLKKNGYPIFECNDLCQCSDECRNRVVQFGRKYPINIVKTEKKGWGVFAGKKIPRGTFVGIYAGEVLLPEDSHQRGLLYNKFGRTYLFDIDFYYLSAERPVPYTIDAYHAGNFTRFLNHSCEPNCTINACYINEGNIEKPLLTIFTLRDVDANEELCFSYRGDHEEEEDDDDDITKYSSPSKGKRKVAARTAAVYRKCECGAPSCNGKLFL